MPEEGGLTLALGAPRERSTSLEHQAIRGHPERRNTMYLNIIKFVAAIVVDVLYVMIVKYIGEKYSDVRAVKVFVLTVGLFAFFQLCAVEEIKEGFLALRLWFAFGISPRDGEETRKAKAFQRMDWKVQRLRMYFAAQYNDRASFEALKKNFRLDPGPKSLRELQKEERILARYEKEISKIKQSLSSGKKLILESWLMASYEIPWY